MFVGALGFLSVARYFSAWCHVVRVGLDLNRRVVRVYRFGRFLCVACVRVSFGIYVGDFRFVFWFDIGRLFGEARIVGRF